MTGGLRREEAHAGLEPSRPGAEGKRGLWPHTRAPWSQDCGPPNNSLYASSQLPGWRYPKDSGLPPLGRYLPWVQRSP